MKIIQMGIILITMKGAAMLADENFETERQGIDVQSLIKHIEHEEYEYYDYDTVTTTTPYPSTYTTTESIKQPSQLNIMDETINEERKIRYEDGRRRSARSYIVNSPRRLSRRKESPPLPSNSKARIMKYEPFPTLPIPIKYPTT